MSYDFDIGTKLICIDVEDYEDILELDKEYTVDSVWYHAGNRQPRVASDNPLWGPHGFLAYRFAPKDSVSLPELEPTMYIEEIIPGADNRLHVIDAKEYDQILLIMERRTNDYVLSATHLKLDADDALDLASDLIRMAMQLKRRTQ